MTISKHILKYNHSNGSTVAALLCASRTRRGEDLRSIARVLCIRHSYLLAIEKGCFHELPGATYASGFIRTYAEHLGLDGDKIIRRFRMETESLAHNTNLAFPLPVTEGFVPTTGVVLTSLVLASIVYGIWFWLSSEEIIIKRVLPIPERLALLVKSDDHAEGETVFPTAGLVSSSPLATASEEKSGGGRRRPPKSEAHPAKTTSTTATAFSSSSPVTPRIELTATEGPYAPVISGDIPVEKSGVLMTASVVPPFLVERRVFGEQNNASRVRLYASNDSWVQVSNGKEVLLRRILRKGDVYYVPNRPGLLLMVGDAGTVSAWIDGVMLPTLGPAGKVRRNVSLDPDRLRAEVSRR